MFIFKMEPHEDKRKDKALDFLENNIDMNLCCNNN